MKTTERLTGLIIISAVMIAAGIFGLVIKDYFAGAIFLAIGIAALIWGIVRRIRYNKHPELKKEDMCPAKDEREMMINLKSTNVVYFTLLLTLLISNVYGDFLAKFLDSSLGDTISIFRTICLTLIILIGAAYFISYAIFQKVN